MSAHVSIAIAFGVALYGPSILVYILLAIRSVRA